MDRKGGPILNPGNAMDPWSEPWLVDTSGGKTKSSLLAAQNILGWVCLNERHARDAGLTMAMLKSKWSTKMCLFGHVRA